MSTAVCESCRSVFETSEQSDVRMCSRCSTTSAGPAQTPTLKASDPRFTPTVISPAPPSAPPPRELPPVPPQYAVTRYLARGGMGYVILARDRKLDRPVAIKMPLPSLVADPEYRERFLREARAAARLRNPNICPIYEVGEHGGGPYIVMAYIDGETLQEWAQLQKPTARRSAEILATLARAVEYAHQHGVIHRDLKPQNVVLERESGQPVLMDFGLAKETRETGSQVTQDGQVVGTPAYMPPEQAAGKMDQVGPRSDVYSLGAILYELVTGRPPFQGTVGEVIHQVQHQDPAPPRKIVPSLHRDVETVCLKALSKNPADRYPDAESFAQDLDAFSSGEAIHARRAGLVGRFARAVRRHPRTALFAVAATLVCAAAVGLFISTSSTARRLTDLRSAIETRLDKGIPSRAALDILDGLCIDLEALNPEAGITARRDVTQGLVDSVNALLEKPKLDSGDSAIVETRLEWLEDRDAAAASHLREKHAGRLMAWETVFDLAAPFERRESIFEKNSVWLDRDRLGARSTKRTKAGSVLPTLVPASGSVELEAHLAGWREVRSVGIGFKSATGRGYAFTLRGPRTDPLKPWKVDLIGSGSGATLEVWRGEAVIKEFRIPVKELDNKELRIYARREGNVLNVQVGNRPSVSFEDIFPLPESAPGTFEVLLSGPVRLVRMRAARLTRPPVSSPLERADQMYQDGELAEALAAYRDEAIRAGTGKFAEEARYKQGVCLIELGRRDEAKSVFEELGAEASGRWPLLALCRVWLHHVEDGQLDEAEQLLSLIGVRYDVKQLAASLPETLRSKIVQAYGRESAGPTLLTVDPNRIDQLKRGIAVVDLLKPDSSDAVWVRWNLMRAYHMEEKLEEAEDSARAALERTRTPDGISGWGFHLTEELSWLLRLRNEQDEALKIVHGTLLGKDGQIRKEAAELLVERARIRCDHGQWAEAEADLDLLVRTVPAEEVSYRMWGGASLLRGFIAHRKGDDEEALKAWRAGTLEQWEAAGENRKPIDSAKEHQFSLILASLTDRVTQAHVDRLLSFFVRKPPGKKGPQDLLQGVLKLRPEMLSEMFRSPRGFEYARNTAFLRITVKELAAGPASLLAYETLRKGRKRPVSDEEEVILWEASQAWVDGYQKGKLALAQLIQLGMTYKGMTGALGWSGLAPKLSPELRGPVAYFLAFRMEQLGKIEPARALWKTARRDAPERGPLRRLAESELRRLKNKK